MERHIRPMQPHDIEPCLALWQRVEGVVLRDESDKPSMLRTFLERNPGLSYVFEDRGAIAGSILCGHDGRRGYLYHLAVREDQRRTRCATALFEATIHGLGSAGITRCHAYVRARNLTALLFWKSVGTTLRRDIDVVTFAIEVGSPDAS